MATWSGPAAGVVTLSLTGAEGSAELREHVFDAGDGIVADKLHTVYLAAAPSNHLVDAALQVVGGDTAIAPSTGPNELLARGLSNGSAQLAIRMGALSPAAAGGASGSEGFNYADIAALEAAGWTKVDTHTGSAAWSMATDVTEGTKSLRVTVNAGSGESYYKKILGGFAPGESVTFRIDVKQDRKHWYENTTGLYFTAPSDHVTYPGPPAGTYKELTETVNADGSGNIEVRVRIGAVSWTVVAWFDNLRWEGAGGGAAATVDFSNLRFCVGSGVGSHTGGGGTGEEPVPPSNEPYAGPGIYGMMAIPTRGAGGWNGTHRRITTTNGENIYNTATAAGTRILITPSGPEAAWAKPFSLSRYLAAVAAVADIWGALILTGFAEGTFPGIYAFDEIQRVDRYGRALTNAEGNAMIAALRSNYPNVPILGRIKPQSATGLTLDVAWAQYRRGRGEINGYIAAALASAAAQGKQVVLSMNVIDYGGTGTGSGTIARWASAADCTKDGKTIIEAQADPAAVPIIMPWQYQQAWYAQAGMANAWEVYLKDIFTAVHG